MSREEFTPSESEWLIMEILWEHKGSMTSKEIISILETKSDMTPKMARVLINRLVEKGMLNFTGDSNDKRVYHYTPAKKKKDCIKEKSRRFVTNFFKGNRTSAIAALIQDSSLTEEELKYLENLLHDKASR
jgi:BlaI family penicillinase repressor